MSYAVLREGQWLSNQDTGRALKSLSFDSRERLVDDGIDKVFGDTERRPPRADPLLSQPDRLVISDFYLEIFSQIDWAITILDGIQPDETVAVLIEDNGWNDRVALHPHLSNAVNEKLFRLLHQWCREEI